MDRAPALPLVVALLLTLGGCARSEAAGDYPSLARRPAERVGFAEPEVPAPAPIAADPALDARLATIRSGLAELTQRFDRDAAAAERAGVRARGRAVGSEAWLTAQSALAELDDARGQLSSLVGELEEVARARAGSVGQDYPALEDARATLARELERQNATIARLAALTPAA